MEINKFYVCPDFFLFFYETKEDAHRAFKDSSSLSDGVEAEDEINFAKFIANNAQEALGMNIRVIDPNELILLLEVYDHRFWNVIIGEKIGWIIANNRLKIKLFQRKELEHGI